MLKRMRVFQAFLLLPLAAALCSAQQGSSVLEALRGSAPAAVQSAPAFDAAPAQARLPLISDDPSIRPLTAYTLEPLS